MPRSEPARMLVQWSRQQMESLRVRLAAWDEDPAIETHLQVHWAGARAQWVVDSVRRPNPEFELQLFDATANFAKALDRTVALFAEARGIDEDEWHGHFPIATRREDYLARLPKKNPRDKALGEIDFTARDIIDRAQPYLSSEPDKAPLRLIARWSRYDKHRMGHPTVSIARGMAVMVVDETRHVVNAYDLWQALNARGKRVEVTAGMDLFSMYPDAAIKPFDHVLRGSVVPRPGYKITLISRTGVAFGKSHDAFWDMDQAFREVERNVLEPLWERLDKLG